MWMIGRFRPLLSCICLVISTGSRLLAAEEPDRNNFASELFLVSYAAGTSLLNSRGDEIQRLDSKTNGAGAISPDGRWIVYSDARPTEAEKAWKSTMIIQSRADPANRQRVPMVWGTTGSSFLPLWSSDSTRILVCEQGVTEGKIRKSVCWLYDLEKGAVKEFELPTERWPSDWSKDGARLLTTPEGTERIAWVNIDGTGEPEFITSPLYATYGARLSPDGQRILCMSEFRRPVEDRRGMRLTLIDLATNKRTVIDEPGHTHGYCWSADGSKVAYTWQRTLEEPAETPVRETLLMTYDCESGQRRVVTRRKLEIGPKNWRNGVVYFFQVHSWR